MVKVSWSGIVLLQCYSTTCFCWAVWIHVLPINSPPIGSKPLGGLAILDVLVPGAWGVPVQLPISPIFSRNQTTFVERCHVFFSMIKMQPSQPSVDMFFFPNFGTKNPATFEVWKPCQVIDGSWCARQAIQGCLICIYIYICNQR